MSITFPRSIRHDKVLAAVEDGYSNLEAIAKVAYEDTPDAHPGLAVDQTLSHLLSHEKNGNVKRLTMAGCGHEDGDERPRFAQLHVSYPKWSALTVRSAISHTTSKLFFG